MEQKLTIILTTISPTLFGTGAIDGLIDTDTLLDNGFPVINPRRVKGLLKEYSNEVLEICGISDYKKKEIIIDYVFGLSHNDNKYNNIKIKTQIEVRFFRVTGKKDFDKLNNGAKSKLLSNYNNKNSDIINYYTTIINQTAIDREKQTAIKNSLRRIRVVREGIKFEGEILCKSDIAYSLISLSILQGCMAGSNRNRGMGEIRFENGEKDEVKIRKFIDTINEFSKTNEIGDLSVKTNNSKISLQLTNEDQKDFELPLEIELLHNTILPHKGANRNVILSETYFTGRKFWGLFANKYLDNYQPDELFSQLFLSNSLKYEPAFIKGKNNNYFPIPLNFQEEKDTKNKVVDLFDSIENTDSKPKKGYGLLSNNNISICEVLTGAITPHHSRQQARIAGRSMDGEMFYYEPIKKGQKFSTSIIGNKLLINKFIEIFKPEKNVENSIVLNIGTSKSVEYGEIKITFKNQIPINKIEKKEKEFIFYFTSPCIIQNENCFAEPSINNLKKTIASFYNIELKENKEAGEVDTDKKIEIESVSAYDTIQNYNQVWRGKTPMEACFAQGSAFKVALQEPIDISLLQNNGIGEQTKLGYGQIKLIKVESNPKTFGLADDNEIVSGLDLKDLPDDSEVFKIIEFKKINDYKSKLKKEGALDAKDAFSNKQIIANSQISNFRTVIKNAPDIGYLNSYKDKLKDSSKKIFSELLNTKFDFVFENLEAEKNDLKNLTKENFDLAKLYFLSYLDMQRMLIKKQAKDKMKSHATQQS